MAIRALFLDFYGTTVHQSGPHAEEAIARLVKSSDAQSPKEALGYWWKAYKELVADACGENYRLQSEVGLEAFAKAVEHFHSSEDPVALRDLMNLHWSTTPAYDDAAWFFDACPVPIYFVTNADDVCIEACAKLHGLKPAGIITSEKARYVKPHPQIFQMALSEAGVSADEVIHVGDSLDGDVRGPQAAGIRPVMMNREGKQVPEGVECVHDFHELLGLIQRENAEDGASA